MLLTIDVGNTQVALGMFRDEELVGHWRFSTKEQTSDEMRWELLGVLALDGFTPNDIGGVAVSSVVPSITATMRSVAPALSHGPVLVIGPGIRTGMSIEIDNPREVGADRVVNAVAGRERYGSPFGQRCLLARRLMESGTRFVEVAYDLNFKNGTGWDTHRHGLANQHLLIEDLDQALSALIEDLQRRRLLDETLIVMATEFGRPPEFDGQGGRGHQSEAFSVALFGGGLKTGQAIGSTDEFGRRVSDRGISIRDFHATILASLGIDPTVELYDEIVRSRSRTTAE